MKEEIFELRKADGTTRTVPGTINGDGFLVMNSTRPVWSGAMIDKTWNRDEARQIQNIKDVPAEHLDCLIRFGENKDGSILARRVDERKKKNDLLRQHGYRWHKESMYVDGYMAAVNPELADYDGDFKDIWVLRDTDGNDVTEQKEEILIDLGYYGEQRKADRIKEREQERIEKERKEQYRIEFEAAKKEIDEFFDNTKSEYPEEAHPEGEFLCFKGKGFNIYGTGIEYVIEDGKAIWKLRNNGHDGDDWSRNNYVTGGAGAIAHKFSYNKRIAKLMKEFMAEA